MIKKITDEKAIMPFIDTMMADNSWTHPMFTTKEKIENNFLKVIKSEVDFVLGVYDEENLLGIFSFMFDEKERYIELLVDFSKESRAYAEVFAYLKEKYPECQMDCVFSPGNNLIKAALKNINAEFYKEQLKMKLDKLNEYTHNLTIVPYSSAYEAGYKAIHSTDVYWLAERVIKAPDIFRVFLALDDDEVVGYIDVTHKYEENEPYDILVKESHRNRGYGKALLQAAIQANSPKAMALLVDYDNNSAINIYHRLGFVDVPEENNITAHMEL